MKEIGMPVQICRGDAKIGSGQLIPNGASLALCPDDRQFRLLNFKTDTNAVEDRIPMTFFCDNQEVSDGELYNSGENICLCPSNQELDLIDPYSTAVLFVEPTGTSARLEVSRHKH